ncbi:MAG: Ig-like domain-containing protein [Gemmatimonadetes bacterium]|nr:Ig-like domain-containing protein [Gemmatimonadota bacterium]
MSRSSAQNGPVALRAWYALPLALVALLFGCRLDLLFKSAGPVQFVVVPPEVLDSAVAGSTSPLNRDVLIQPNGSDPVAWKASVAAGSSWLVMKTSAATGAGKVTLSLTPSSLAAGTYYDTILVAPDGWEDRAIKVPVQFTVRTPSFQLVFTVQPANGRAGSAISPAVQVAARDAWGRTVTSFAGDVTMSLGTNPTGATLSGTTTVAAVNGVARFADLKIDRPGIGYRLRATSGSLSVTSNSFSMGAPKASPSLSSIAPAATTVPASDGSSSATITVTVRDEDGVPIPDAPVVLGATGSDNTFAPASGATDENGIFSSSFSSTRAESKTVSATVDDVVIAPRTAVLVTPAPATTLEFSVQPSDAREDQTITPAVEVSANDRFDNTARGFDGIITIAIEHDGSVLSDATLRGDRTVRASAGVSRFDDLKIDRVGTGYTLRASASGFASVISNPFNVYP